MRGPLFAIAGAGVSFVGAVLCGAFLGWLIGAKTGHPALVVAGLFLGMFAGAILVGSMVVRLKF